MNQNLATVLCLTSQTVLMALRDCVWGFPGNNSELCSTVRLSSQSNCASSVMGLLRGLQRLVWFCGFSHLFYLLPAHHSFPGLGEAALGHPGCEWSSHSLGQVLSGAPASCSLASPEEWASLRYEPTREYGIKKEKSRSEARDFPANS